MDKPLVFFPVVRLNLALCFCLLILVGERNPLRAQPNIIYHGAKMDAVEDLRHHLQDYPHVTLLIEQVPLEQRDGQSFFLQSTNGQYLLQYTTAHSLSNGVYTLLHKWGFRWYGPAEHWTVKPKSLEQLNLPGKWYQPDFRDRQFFGTGGLNFVHPHPFDLQNTYAQDGEKWKIRNRVLADFGSSGHTGRLFYLENKTLLDAHPEWFSSVNGKENGRLKIDQPAAVQAYVNWVVRKAADNKNEFVVVAADPEDGRGGADDPLPKKMPQIKNHADKWWWLVNKVAAAFPESNNHIKVMAYAYGDGEHNVRVPNFPLRKNVYPIIIPYAYQKAFPPNELLRRWRAHVKGDIAVYDYWNTTSGGEGRPLFTIDIGSRIQYWKTLGLQGVYLETTESAGPMGMQLWLAAQLLWGDGEEEDILRAEYLKNCFGAGSIHMNRLFARWKSGYRGAADLALSAEDLRAAGSVVQIGSPEWKRLTDIKAYLIFLKMYDDHDGGKNSRDRIFQYLYRIHHLRLLQTAAFMGQQLIEPGGLPPAPSLQPRYAYQEITALFDQTFSVHDKSLPHPVNFDFDFAKVRFTSPIPEWSWRYGGFRCHFFFIAPFTGNLLLDAGGINPTPIKIFTEDASLINTTLAPSKAAYTESFEGRTWFMYHLSLPVEKGKRYALQTSYGLSRVKIKSPGVVLFKHPGEEDFEYYAYPVQYFYVPHSAKEVVYYDPTPEGMNGRGWLVNPEGKIRKREATGLKNYYRVTTQPSERGKVWQADFGHSTWSFQNIPNITALQPFSYVE